MEIEVVLPVPLPSSPEFSFDSATSTPYITAPSSPQRLGGAAATTSNHFYSSPATATATSVDHSRTSFSINPALWEEENPGVSGNSPKSTSDFIDFDDFEFEFDGSKSDRFECSPALALADELFDRGRIKPMKMMTPPLEQSNKAEPSSVSSAATATTTTKRVCDILAEEDEEEEEEERPMNPAASSTSASPSSSKTFSSLLPSITIPKGYRKWSLRDFLLFRSASEGRGTSKDPLRKFPTLGGKIGRSDGFGDSMRGTSFRAAPAREESSGRRQRSRGAHEVYYSANRAVAEEMKRRTLLPYKRGLLGGCLGFNPNPGAHDLARGFGSLHPRD